MAGFSRSGEGGEQGLHFVGELGGVGKGLGDFIAEKFAVAAAEAMNGDAHGAFSHGKTGGNLRIGNRVFVGGEEGFDVVEETGFADGSRFVTETGEHTFEERECPFAVVDAVGSEVVGGFDLVTGIGALPIEGESGQWAAAFLAAGFVPFIGEKVLERGEEEGAETAFFGAEAVEVITFEETGEETLSEILGILAGVAAAADVGVERIPIDAAEFGEGFFGLGRGTVAGGDDGRPVCSGEGVVRRRGGSCLVGGQLVGNAISRLFQHQLDLKTEILDATLQFVNPVGVVEIQSSVQFLDLSLLFEDQRFSKSALKQGFDLFSPRGKLLGKGLANQRIIKFAFIRWRFGKGLHFIETRDSLGWNGIQFRGLTGHFESGFRFVGPMSHFGFLSGLLRVAKINGGERAAIGIHADVG